MARYLVVAIAVFVVALVGSPTTLAAPSAAVASGSSVNRLSTSSFANTSSVEWLSYMHDSMRSGYNAAETSLSGSNSARLVPLWQYQTGGLIAASPIVSNHKVFIGSWDGYEYALNSTTGALIWKTFLNYTYTGNCPIKRGVSSTPTHLGSNLYLGGGDSYWYDLNTVNGAIRWSVFVGNNSVTSGHYNWASPLIYNGNAYIGVSSNCDTPLVQGGLLEVNLTSQKVIGQFNTSTNRIHGASVWGSPTVDPIRNTVYFATGNAGTYGDSVIALNATTMALVGNWTVPASQLIPDGDFGSTPTVFHDSQGNGRVGVASKNGIFYAFDSSNISKGPVWEDQIATGGDNPVAGQGSISPAAYDGLLLYVAGGKTNIGGIDYTGAVRAVDPSTGKYLWEHGAPGPVLGGLAAANGIVVDASGPNLEVLNATSGGRILDYPTTSALFDAPSIAEGQLFVGSASGMVYGFGFSNGSWSRPFTPPALSNSSAAYDTADGYSILFGGCGVNLCPVPNTWRWSGSTWTDLTPAPLSASNSPTARLDAGMAYDPGGKSLVLFGGYAPGQGDLGDTWTFHAGAWTQLSLSTHPSGRASMGMVYDPLAGGIVLFGGLHHTSTGNQELSDVWLFGNGKWSQPKIAGGKMPGARDSVALAYDTADRYLLLFGGHASSGVLSDSWALGSKWRWSPLPVSLHPAARYAGAATYDSQSSAVVLFGGRNSSRGIDGSTWEFAKGAWKNMAPTSGPAIRASMGFTYDPIKQYTIIYGGLGAGGLVLSDTWRFNLSGWGHIFPANPGGARYGAGAAYDAQDGYLVIFGGHNPGSTVLSDTQKFNGTGYVSLCKGCTPGHSSPLGRFLPAMAYDPADGYVVLFGGFTNSSVLGDTWIFARGTWTNVTPAMLNASNSPSQRGGAQLAYDLSDGYLVLFGGSMPGSVVSNETWEFHGGAWSQLSPGVSPSAREGAAMTETTSRNGVLLFGGRSGSTYFNDTWVFTKGAWTKLATSSAPSARSYSGLAEDLDPAISADVLVGGFNGTYLGDVWELQGTGWTPIYRPSSPSPRSAVVMEFDPNLLEIVVYSGHTAGSGVLSASTDTWIFRSAT